MKPPCIRHRVSPEFIGSRNCVPMAFPAESPPAQGQLISMYFGTGAALAGHHGPINIPLSSHAHCWYEVSMLKVQYYYLVLFVWTVLPYVCIVRCGRPSTLMWLCKYLHHRTSCLAYEWSMHLYCCVYTFGLTVSEAKTEIMSLRAKGRPGSTATFSVEAASKVYNQTNEFVYLGGNVKQRRPVHRGLSAYAQRMVQLPEVHPRTVRPTERSPRAQNQHAKSRGTRDNAVRLRHVEPARVPLRHTRPSPPQVLDSLHRLATHACQDGK